MYSRSWRQAGRTMEKQEKTNTSLLWTWMNIAGVVSLYWFVSISMVFLNKYLLSSKELQLDAPLFITLSQCVVAVLCFLLLGFLSKFLPDVITFPYPEYSLATAMKVAPLSVVFVGMITFNNLTLKCLGVAFYNVGRSLTTVFNVVFSFLFLGQKLSMAVLACCGVIVAGFLFGIKEEDQSVPNLSFIGVLFGVLASMCVALYAIFTKRTLPHVEDNIWRLQFYNNVNACCLLAPTMLLLGELPVLIHFHFWGNPLFWGILITSGMFGIAIGYVSSLQIKVTSPLSHNVSGTAKACAQTVLACIVYAEAKSFWWWMCNMMVLGGSSAYTYVRMQEMKMDKSQPEQEQEQKEQLESLQEDSEEGRSTENEQSP